MTAAADSATQRIASAFAAIGLRGNIFGTFGSRISTTIHAGTFRLSTRRDTVLGQNVLAAGILTLAMSLLLAVTTKAATPTP